MDFTDFIIRLIIVSPIMGALSSGVALFYLLPSIIAYSKNKSNRAAIFITNIALAWAVVPWILTLVWATKNDDQIVVNIEEAKSTANQSLEDKLKEITSLKEKGLITEDEYNAQRSSILS